MRIVLLGTGGMAPSGSRETACTLVRDGRSALLLDCGTGARRLLGDRSLLDGIEEIDVVLTHFHLDHVCGLTYLPSLGVGARIWAPGAWLYGTDSSVLLRPLREPPISPTDTTVRFAVRELREGSQEIAGFTVRASAQPRHWGPSAGLRVDDALALVTDTPYERSSAVLSRGVRHLLHEAWSSSAEPLYPDRDATASDAARVAAEAGAGELTLIHLNPLVEDHSPLIADAVPIFERTRLGEDEVVLSA
jgi:ribonuclease BN (tRNA processing enzyme)